MILLQSPPKMVYGQEGQPIEVILSIDDYRAYLRDLVENYDWELLPAHLQDAVDVMLIEESRAETTRDNMISIDNLLAE